MPAPGEDSATATVSSELSPVAQPLEEVRTKSGRCVRPSVHYRPDV